MAIAIWSLSAVEFSSLPLTSSSQDIPARLAKLQFLVDELALTSELAKNAPDSDIARLVARHTAVRTLDFIEHAGRVRKPLGLSSADNAEFKSRIKNFSDTFDSYFGLARNRVSAHLQDIDLIDRAELWVSIDRAKVEYFFEGAREIWDLLGTFGAPGHAPFVVPTALADPVVAEKLTRFGQGRSVWPSMAIDWLGATRPNALVAFTGTPVHARAGQLASLRRWIRAQTEMLVLFRANSAIARIMKARLITDIVSFHDCLITRPVASGASQAMDGLDTLLGTGSPGAAAISEFVASNNDALTIDPLRDVRNRIGAHLETDPAIDIATLLAELDAYKIEDALDHYDRLEAVFLKACRLVVFLKPYLADGSPIHGVKLVNANRGVAFDPGRPDAIASSPLPKWTFSSDEMASHLAAWTGRHGTFAEPVLSYFRDAFSWAPAVATLDYWDEAGAGRRLEQLTMRVPHRFLCDHLVGFPDDAGCICDLLVCCAGGHPPELAQTLMDARGKGLPLSLPFLHALGEVAAWWQQPVRQLLEDVIAHGPATLAPVARIALLTMYLRDEGPSRINKRPRRDWGGVRDIILSGLPAVDRMATLMALASCFVVGKSAHFLRVFGTEYSEMANEAVAAARAALAGTLDVKREAALRDALGLHRVTKAARLVVESGPSGHAASAKTAILTALGDGTIRVPREAGELSALAECMVLAKASEQAIPILDEIARMSPAVAEPHLRKIEILGTIPSVAAITRQQIEDIRRRFSLDQEGEDRLGIVEAILSPA